MSNKTREITQKTDKEIIKLIETTRTDIAKAYVDMRTSQVANVKQISNLKLQLARALTIAREREIAKSIEGDKTAKATSEKAS